MSEIPFVIINPKARSGKLGKNLEKYLNTIKEYLGEFEYKLTTASRDEVTLAENAIKEGYTTLLAFGGDGTATNTADVLAASENKNLKFGLISGGSMCDWHKTVSIPLNLEGSLQIIADGHVEPFPAMKCTGDKVYYSFEMADGGFSAAAADAANYEAKWIKNPDIKYIWLALKYVIKTKNTNATVTIDDNEPIHTKHFTNAFAAFGDEQAGFVVLPGNDHFSFKNKDLGIAVVHGFKGFRRIWMLVKSIFSKHTGMKGIWMTRGKKIVVESERPLIWQAEGEIFNKESHKVTIERIDNAINLFVPKDRTYNDQFDDGFYKDPFEVSFKKRKYKLKKDS